MVVNGKSIDATSARERGARTRLVEWFVFPTAWFAVAFLEKTRKDDDLDGERELLMLMMSTPSAEQAYNGKGGLASGD